MKWLQGYIVCEVDFGQWERFMNMCRYHRIHLWHIQIKEKRTVFCMFSKDYKRLMAFVGKTHVVPRIRERCGGPFLCENALQNWTFTFGIVLFFLLLQVFSMFIWQINYIGQREYTKETIQKDVTGLGIYPGMRRSNLNCDSIERTLRENYENMSWVSAEEKGCVLNIKIKEGSALGEEKEQEQTPQHVIAPCDGTIQSIVTREGTAQVTKGTNVKKGDILISGIVEIKDDNEQVVRYKGVPADGEITILNEEPFKESINIRHVAKNRTGKDIKVYTVCWNETRFSVKNPLKWFDNSVNYDIMNDVCVDREFMPLNSKLRITQRTYISYEKTNASYNEKEASDILQSCFESRLMSLEEKGYCIESKSLTIKKVQKTFQATGIIKMSINKMDTQDIPEEELTLQNQGKEDEDGAGTENS